jgi:hypothetical protein
VFWGSTYAIRGFKQLTFAKRGFQQLSFPDVAFAPKYYARCGFRSYTGGNPAIVLCDPRISAANFSTCDASTFDSGHA